MAFPTVIDVTTTAPPGTNQATWPINLSGSIVAGRLLLATVVNNSTGTITPSAGWRTIANSSWASPGFTVAVNTYAKVAAGSDALTVTLSPSHKPSSIAYQIGNWSGSVDDVRYAFTDNTIDPPALAAGSNADNLWLAYCANLSGVLTVPTNYTDLVSLALGGGQLLTARRLLTAQTEDPPTFGGTPSFPSAWTVCIPPPVVRSGAFFPFLGMGHHDEADDTLRHRSGLYLPRRRALIAA